ncbi:hypothetical protein OG252_27565 [Streptomyces sp. NBC_01352]|uniref:hypothetical protein n=1 Tax=unclassified Streptomyces TaxID=2593676 RepID=UPI00224FD646|nr:MULTISPECIES: hypothetical protein [unclassified Streptomyces]MCX4699749.1 hypothetical protein [Streptomyces sp. NBC_01373]
MFKQVSHTVAGTDPAGFALALEVAYALHAPVTTRAPEVATAAHGAGRRAKAAARRRATVRG